MALFRAAMRLRATPPANIQHSFLDSTKRACRLNPLGAEGRSSRKGFRGPVRAAILDWSGTTADMHVLAPAVVFYDVFQKAGVPISMVEARVPMGLRKDLHIAKILEDPEVARRWTEIKGTPPTPMDVNTLFADFVPLQLACIQKYATLLPGVADTVDKMKTNGIKIGTTTGFLKDMVDILLREAAKQGYVPDSSVAGDQVPNNMGFRPAPFMIYQNLVNLGVFPIESVVKVDDTIGGVGEGLNAGCWAIGVANWSNYTDIDSLEQWEAMPEPEREARREQSRAKLYTSGAHYVIDELTDLPNVIEDINARLGRGEMPYSN